MLDVLIVDDNADIRRLLKVCLQDNYEVAEAADGHTALQMMRELHPKIVMLDVMMPGELNGFQVVSAIREDADLCETTVVFITALSEESYLKNSKKHGADAYLIKPFSTWEVKDWVRSQLAPRDQ